MEDNKQYIVSIPGMEGTSTWDEEKYNRAKDKLYADHPDAQIVEASPYDSNEKQSPGDYYQISVPGKEGVATWDAQKFSAKRDALLNDHPDAQISRVRPVNYWGDKLSDNYSRRQVLEQELAGYAHNVQPTGSRDENGNWVETTQIVTPSKDRKKAINEELDRLNLEREQNPVWRQYWDSQVKDIESLRANAKSEKESTERDDLDREMYGVAEKLYDDAYKIASAPSKYNGQEGLIDKSEQYVKDMARGAWENAWDAVSMVSVANAMKLGANLVPIIKQITKHEGEKANILELSKNPEKLEYLSNGERELLHAFGVKAEVEAGRSADLSSGYKAGKGVAQSVGFMSDFLLMGGAVEGIGKKAIEKTVEGTAKRLATETLYGAVKAAALTPIMASSYTNFVNNMMQFNDEGGIDLSAKAIRNAVQDVLIENESELIGAAPLQALGIGVGKALPMEWLSKSKLGGWGKALRHAPAARVMKQAGWNGLVEEMFEEITGNALRAVTKTDPDALKNFFTPEELLVTATSFLPMSLLNTGASAAQYTAASAKMRNDGVGLEEVLKASGMHEEQIEKMIDQSDAETPEQLAKNLSKAYDYAAKSGQVSPARALEATLDYAKSAAEYKVITGIYEEQKDIERTGRAIEIDSEVGSDVWHYQKGDDTYVRTFTDQEGNSYYFTGEEDGTYSTVDGEGRLHYINESNLGEYTDSGEVSLKDYLDESVNQRNAAKDQLRVEREAQAARQQLEENIRQNTPIPMGTEENRQVGTLVIDKQTGAPMRDAVGSYYVETNEGWQLVQEEDLASKWGIELTPKTQEQIEEDEVSRMEATDERKTAINAIPKGTEINAMLEGEAEPAPHEFIRAFIDNENQIQIIARDMQTGEEVTLPEEAFPELEDIAANFVTEQQEEVAPQEETQRDYKGDTLPLDAEGEVDEEKLWNDDPVAWATWNDSQRNDGGVNSKGYIQAAVARVGSEISELEKAYASELDFKKRKAIEQDLADKTSRLNTLTGVLNAYETREAAAQAAAEAQTQEEIELAKAEEAARVEAERQKPLEERARGWEKRTGQKVNIFHSYDEIPKSEVTARTMIRMSGKRNRVAGWYGTSSNSVMIYLPGSTDEADIDKTFMHELISHKGLREMLGEGGFNELMDHTWNDIMSEEDREKYMAYVGYMQASEEEKRRAAADEYVAHLAENIDSNPSAWDKFVAKVKEILQRLGFDIKITDADLKTLIQASLARYEAQAKAGNEEAAARLADSGIASNIEETRFSVKYAPKTEEEANQIAKDISEQVGVSEEDAKKWVESETTLAAVIEQKENQPYLEYTADDRYNAIKENSDYPQGTVDFNNICRKRIAFTEMYQRIQKAFPNVIITGEDLANIRNIMKSHGLTVACGLCYVEDRRQLLGEIAKDFIDNYANNFEDYASRGGEAKKKNAEKFRKLLGEDRKDDLSIYDLITLTGSTKLYEEHPGIYEAFQAFNNARGQQTGNLFQGYAEYKREILKWTKSHVDKVNRNGGLRVFSYSDFEAHHLIDLVQIIQDCARKGVKIQGYTKVPAFARAVANTNIKLNRSLIPLGDTGIVDGRLAYDSVEGIDINDENFLESNDNIGNILIGINDEQIRLAMADPFIHYIIPYHSNQKEILRTLKQTGAWTNYKPYQNEKDSTGKTTLLNIYTDVIAAAEAEGNPIQNERQFTEKFLEVCEQKGLTPRFEQFLDRKGGKYVYTPGYYKLLLDFKMFDENGRYLPQNPVVAQFDDKFNTQILNDYVKGEQEKFEGNLDAVYNEIISSLGLEDRVNTAKKGQKALEGIIDSINRKNAESLKNAEAELRENGASYGNKAVLDAFGLESADMTRRGDVVTLNKLVAKQKKKGSGTRFMTALAQMADRNGWTLALTPSKDFGASSVKRLKDFYKRFGFLENKGKNTDFTINESMLRIPSNETPSRTMFRISNADQTIFISNAEKAVEEMKMDKATPEQWKKTLEKNGGLKAAEDKWLGLSTWLDGLDRKTVTKQEILDFIAENQIKIEETHYSDEGIAEEEAALKSYQDEIDEIIAGNGGDIDAAWSEMIDRYGDDFEMAFTYDVNPGNNIVLEPATDFNDEPSDAARYFIEQRRGGSEKGINSIRKGYTTEGLRNLHEIALTVPTIEPWNESDQIHFGDAGEGRAISWARFGDTWTSKAKDEAEKAYREADKAFWDYRKEIVNKYALQATDTKKVKDLATEEENAKVKELQLEADRLYHEWQYGQHPREKVLVIDEIQSKRHQEGREKGYRMTDKERAEVFETSRNAWRKYQDAQGEYSSYLASVFGEAYDPVTMNVSAEDYELVSPSDEQTEHINELANSVKRALNEWREANSRAGAFVQDHTGTIPVAPFEKNWPELTMKRMLRYAAEFGYDTVAWTTGEQQADRYNIGDVLEKLVVKRNEDGTYNVYGHRIDDISKSDEEFAHDVPAEELSGVVGKDVAKKAVENESDTLTLEGENLRIGAEGMKGFYDDILPRWMNKYGKKWGVKVEDIFLPALGTDAEAGASTGVTMHSVKVTPEMKESVMQGQLMFRMAEYEKEKDAVDKITVFHGTGADFDRFDHSHMGEGEGNQSYGWGTYVTTNKDTGITYARHIGGDDDSVNAGNRHLYTVEIPADNGQNYIHWEKPITMEQSKKIMDAVRKVANKDEWGEYFEQELKSALGYGTYGRHVEAGLDYFLGNEYNYATDENPGAKRNALLLNDAGIVGIEIPIDLSGQKRYEGSNYVIFNEDDLNIVDHTRFRITPEQDAEYLAAVENGDMEKADRMVREAAAAAMPDTVVVDSDGLPKKVLHGTNAEFNTFDEKKIGSATDPGWLGRGFYFYGNSPEYASQYGKRVISAYLNITDPYYADSEDIRVLSAFNSEEVSNSFRQEKEDDGYDGVNYNGDLNDEWVAFYPNQIKSADPVTYDDQGNVIPLSERFNPGNEDIRFSIRPSAPMTNEEIIEAHTLLKSAVGRELTKGESEIMIRFLDNTASPMPEEIPLTKENYDKYFSGGVETPLGKVKMSDGQYKKLEDLKRENVLALALETLVSPDTITEKPSKAKEGSETERGSSLVYIKTFAEDREEKGRVIAYFNSVSSMIQGLEIVMSNYVNSNRNQIKREYQEGKLAYIKDVTLPIESVTSTQGDQNTVPDGANSFNGKDSDNSEISNEGATIFRIVQDPLKVAELEAKPKVKVYRSMQEIDGKLYPPMSARVEGELREPTKLGVWEESEERPELADEDGNFKLDKGNKKSLKAAYAPYFHTRRSPLNEQFSEAYNRPNLVIVEGEIPESELTSGYTAEKSKKSVGEHDWPSGKVSNALAKKGQDTRNVILSRWFKPVRIVPNSEVADMIMERLGDSDIAFPNNVVTPGLREELKKRGAKFSGWQGNKPENVDEIIAGMEGDDTRFRIAYHGSPNEFEEFDTSYMGDGEGHQSHGWGIYVSLEEGTARRYGYLGDRDKVVYQGQEPPTHYAKELVATMTMDMANKGTSFDEAKKSILDSLNYYEEKRKDAGNYWRNTSYKREIDFFENLTADDFEINETHRNLYMVDIPEDTGENYIDEQKNLKKPMRVRIADAIRALPADAWRISEDEAKLFHDYTAERLADKVEKGPVNGEDVYANLSHGLGSPRAASEFLSDAGFVGIKYVGGVDGPCAVIFKADDIKIDDHIRFRITPEQDREYMDVVNAGDMNKAQEMVDEAAEAAGYTIRGYHGTTHNFTIFDRSKGNAEGNWGKGFYFTNNLDDAEANYGNEDGPDLQAKIERLAENMEWMDGYEDMDYDERKLEAAKMLTGDNPHVISAAIRMSNPVVFNSRAVGPKETFFDFDSGYNPETDEYEGEESGLLLDFIDAWNEEMQEPEWEMNNISPNEILEYGDDGLTASQLEQKAREILDNGGLQNEEGDLASGEFLRAVFERMGFDGIVDSNVNIKFGTQRRYGRSMDGMDYGTTHFVAFQPEQIKQSDPVTYDDNGNVIPLSERFNDESNDIRFSIRGIIGVENAEDQAALDNLEVAEEMEKKGKDSPTIWWATGWERGADGKWRNEIPDAKQKEGVDLKPTNRAGDILDAPELFKSYPQIEDIEIELKNLPGSTVGVYMPKENKIVADINNSTELEKGKQRFNSEGIRTILHELQHAIQYIEGFAKGGTEKSLELDRYKEVLKEDPALAMLAFTVFSRGRNSAAKVLRAGRSVVLNQAKNLDISMWADSDKDAFHTLIERLKGMDESEFQSFAKNAAKLAKEAKKYGDSGYKKLAGEVEARNVERRSHLNDELRGRITLRGSEDVTRGEQIVRFRIGEAKDIPGPTGEELVKRVQAFGLRGVLDKENADGFWSFVLQAMPEDSRKTIIETALGKDLNIRRQTREYLAGLASKGFENDDTGLLRAAADRLEGLIGTDQPLTDNELLYMLWRGSNRYSSNDILGVAADITRRKRLGIGEFGKTFPGEAPALQAEAEKKVEEANEVRNEERKTAARQARKTPLAAINTAMTAQRRYDQDTVNEIVTLAKQMIKEGNIDSVSAREMARLMTIIKAANGRKTEAVKNACQRLMDFMVDHTIDKEKNLLEKILKVKTAKVKEPGVDVQAKLDLRAQGIINSFRDNRDLGENEIREKLAEIEEKLDSPRTSETRKEELRAEADGLNLALQYQTDIAQSEAEEKGVNDGIKISQSDFKDLTPEERKRFEKAYKEGIEASYDMIRKNKIDRVNAYRELRAAISNAISEGAERAKTFLEAERERVNTIHHQANSDMQGISDDPIEKKAKGLDKLSNSAVARMLLGPLASFDQMLRMLGRKHVDGRGYLWNRFMGQLRTAADNEKIGLDKGNEKLNKKLQEIFDDPQMVWNDLYSKESGLPKTKIRFFNANGEWVEKELTAGNLLYIYMVDKMPDGRMKLRQMGIDENDVENIKRNLDPRFIELADWVQEEFLTELRDKYNEVHKRLFGTSMAAIENYFPLRILGGVIREEVDLSNPDSNVLPSAMTGAIIKRTVNRKQLDITGTDAFSTVIEHLQEMEHWAAYAEVNRDLGTLLSYKRFQNQMKNMNTIYGSGKELWNTFKKTAILAAGEYRPVHSSLDKAVVNIAKGVTAAKISFRAYTALKQVLSWPAFLADANPVELAKATAPTSWYKNWKWAMENLPNFKKRVESRKAGNEILEDTDLDANFWKTDFMKFIGQYGMSMNAFVDALTVSIGSKAIYETRLKNYLKDGYSQEEAEKKAKMDAVTAFNETQQSSEKEFMSIPQADRTVASVALTVYRNSSMGYQRQLHHAIRTLGRMAKKGYKEESIEFMTKQMVRDGLSEDQARAAAERNYKRAGYQAAVRAAVFGWVVQFAWNLGSHAVYLLFGDDPDEKKKMLMEDAVHACLGGTVEGLAGGNVISEMANMLAQGKSLYGYSINTLPIMSDIQTLMGHMKSDPVAAANELVYLAAQIGLGTNPQTMSDAIVAIIDACNGDVKMSKEVMICIMRILAVPQSQIDEIMIDEIGLTAEDAKKLSYEEVAKRYVDYKMTRNAPVTGVFYSDEAREKREKSHQTTFKKKVNERKKLKEEK